MEDEDDEAKGWYDDRSGGVDIIEDCGVSPTLGLMSKMKSSEFCGGDGDARGDILIDTLTERCREAWTGWKCERRASRVMDLLDRGKSFGVAVS